MTRANAKREDVDPVSIREVEEVARAYRSEDEGLAGDLSSLLLNFQTFKSSGK